MNHTDIADQLYGDHGPIDDVPHFLIVIEHATGTDDPDVIDEIAEAWEAITEDMKVYG